MLALAHIFGNLFCVVLLLIMISGIISEQESREKNTFLALIFTAMLYIQCSTFWQMMGGSVMNHRVYCTLSRCLCAVLGYACFQYLYLMTTGRFSRSLAALVPGILLTVLSVASIWTGWLFRVDGDNLYAPGAWYALDRILANAYYVMLSLIHI